MRTAKQVVLHLVTDNILTISSLGLTARQARGSRSSRRVSRQVYNAKVAALQYGDSEESDEDEEDDELEELDTASDPLWKLYSSVRNFTTERGVEI